jgi:hypothetical protein
MNALSALSQAWWLLMARRKAAEAKRRHDRQKAAA